MKYNPAFLQPDELISSFVVRQVDLDLILDTLRDNSSSGSNQHVLVIGPRGIGKTTLVLRAAAEVRTNPEFSSMWYPLVFGEEAYEVSSPGEFWLESLFHLGEQTQDERWQRTYKELKGEASEARLRERALAQLMDFADEQGKRILIVVENLRMLLGEQMNDDGAWVLRHTLLNEPRVMLLASATSRFEEIDGSNKAMFDLFRIHELKPLDDGECKVLWASIAGQEPAGEQIRPIRILTGGNPRLVAIIATFAARSSFRELMSNLVQLVDDHTDYFKSHLDSLPPQERKAFVALADIWDPATTSEVAEAARLPVNKVSTHLLRLVSKGAVVEVDQTGGKKRYQLAERMYNIYHLMRRRGSPSRRVDAAVRFMVHFYEAEQLAKSIAEEAMRLPPEEREDHFGAYASLLRCAGTRLQRHSILSATPLEFIEYPDIPGPKSGGFTLAALRDETQMPQLPDVPSSEAGVRGRLAQAVGDAKALTDLGDWLRVSNHCQHAEDAYEQATIADPHYGEAWLALGLLRLTDGRHAEAREAALRAADLMPDYGLAWGLVGITQHVTGHTDAAEEAYRRALGTGPEIWAVWVALGRILQDSGRHGAAAAAYRRAAELNTEDGHSWVYLGVLLFETGGGAEAEQAYGRGMEIGLDAPDEYVEVGELLRQRTDRVAEAEVAYRRAIELDPDNAAAWKGLGSLLHHKTGRFAEAEQAYRRAVELDPQSAWPYAALGSLLYKVRGLDGEVERMCRRSIELDPSSRARFLLVNALAGEPGRAEDALELAEMCLQRTRRSPDCLHDVALALVSKPGSSHLDKAEAWSHEAVEKAPHETEYHLTLAILLMCGSKWQEAVAIVPRLLSDAGWVRQSMPRLINLIIVAAGRGYGPDILGMLEDSPSARVLEPLNCGLRMYQGEEVNVSQEIREVAQDIVSRIRQRQSAPTEPGE